MKRLEQLKQSEKFKQCFDEDGNLKPGYQLNPLGIPVRRYEMVDPVPKRSRVAFKKPLSAAERVLRAIKQRELLLAMDRSQPEDDSFDGPDYEQMSPHQLMVDEESGQEMTAGEHVMLQEERRQARLDIEKVQSRIVNDKRVKKAEPKAKKTESSEDSE